MNLLKNQQMAETVDSVFIDLENLLMENIARHLSDWGKPIDTDRWLLQKLAEIGKLNQENIQLIAQMSGKSQLAVERMLKKSVEDTISELEPSFQKMVQKGYADKAVSVGKSENVKRVNKALQSQAKDTINLTNTTMLHKAQEAFKTLAKDTSKEALRIMNSNVSAVLTGAESRQQALRRTIRQFNEKGITGFVDKKGRNWTPEAYVNMVMRTTVGSVANEMQTARCKDYGINLISIDAHSGARPKCARDQGKIFDLNNGSGTTEDLHGRKIKYYPWKSSSYGEPDGLLGINCRHHKYPFVPGVNIQRYFPTEDLDANDKLYKETQVQRALERDVRKQKRECMLYDTIGDEEGFEKASVKLKAKEANLRNYVDTHSDLHRRKDREQVVGFDKRISAEAVGKAQSHYKNWAKSIGAESEPKRLAGYYDLKYNDSKESRLYKGYIKAVNKGNISPLVGYDLYKEISTKAEKALVGNYTSDGKEIKYISVHLTDRIIGQQVAGDIPKPGKRMGVSIENVREALLNGKAGEIVERADGRKGQQFISDKCYVSFNPDTGTVVQVSPKGGKK